MPLLEGDSVYRPFAYPWAHDFWRRQQQMRWLPGEVPLGEDCRDWAERLGDHERNLVVQLFRYLVAAGAEIQDCYYEKYSRVFRPAEIRMMLVSFGNAVAVQVAAGAHFLDTVGMPEEGYGDFLSCKEMRDKIDHLATFTVDSDHDVARTLATFGGFAEGLQLFSSFAMLMNFPRFRRLAGMGEMVRLMARDATLHAEGTLRLFHAFCAERQCLTRTVRDDIADICQKAVRLEDAFVDLAFEMGQVAGMGALETKKYIRFVADLRLQQLGLQPVYLTGENPLPWLQPLLSASPHATSCEVPAAGRAVATRGNWHEVWEGFDSRRAASRPPATEGDGDAPRLLEAAEAGQAPAAP